MESSDSLYDSDSTIFSPDGRLFQVEYARETIKKGVTTIALKFQKGILFTTYRENHSKLVETDSNSKIFKLSENIGCTFIGLSADARNLIDYAIEEIAINDITYDEKISVKSLVENICKYKHAFTMFNGIRPFGVVLFIGGIDQTGIRLFATDPSGSFLEYKVVCEGKNIDNITKFIEKNYKEKVDLNKAVKIVFESIQKTTKKKIDINNFEIAVIEKDKPFYKFQSREIQKILR